MFFPIEKTRLDNGLTVLVCPQRRTPLVCVLILVRCGYLDEDDTEVGLSHFIEHVFFKGTQRRPPGRIAQEIRALGGYVNAATSYEHTYYYAVVPSSGLIPTLDILADTLAAPDFDAAELEREKGVVIAEIRRKRDNPMAMVRERLLDLAFPLHRVGRFRMGTPEGIGGFSRDKVVGFFNRHYRPGDMILSVTGDVSVPETFEAVERLYGSMPQGSLERDEAVEEPWQEGPRLKRFVSDISQAVVSVGFRFPPLEHEDFHAAQALAVLLASGRSSRWYRALKEDSGLADAVDMSLHAFSEVGFFALEAHLKPVRIAAVEEELWAEAYRLFRDPPTPQEMDKVRAQLSASFRREWQDVFGAAYGLARFEAMGDYRKAEDYIAGIHSVTAREVLGAARKYLTFQRMNLLECVPKDVGEGVPWAKRLESLAVRVASRSGGDEGVVEACASAGFSVAAVLAGTSERLPLDVKPIKLEGGATLVNVRTGGLPITSVAVYFPGGRSDEAPANCGLTQFLLKTSLRGTERRSSHETAFALESLGALLKASASADYFGYTMNLPTESFEAGLELMGEAVLCPALAPREIEREKAATISGILDIRDDMFRYPIELFYRALFGVHAYALPRRGTVDTVTSFTREQVSDWYRQTFRWPRMVLAVVGDLTSERVEDAVRRHFGPLRSEEEIPRAEIVPIVPDRGAREIVETRDRAQTAMAVGFAGVASRDRSFFALEVLRNLLSGMGGRLHRELRERRGLVYSATAFNIGLLRTGAFFAYAASAPPREAEVRDVLLGEFERAVSHRPGEEELCASKAYTVGSHTIGLQTNVGVAYHLVGEFLSNRRLYSIEDFTACVESVTAEDVRRAAEEVFDVNNAAFGVVRGPVS